MTRSALKRGLLVVGAGAVLAPALALAGPPATSGDQKLQIKTSLIPAKAGAKPVILGIEVSYTNPKNPSQQPPYDVKRLIFTGRYLLHPSAVPACKLSSNAKAGGKTSGCPDNTKVGSGTVEINASPTIKQPITGTVTLYNGVNDDGSGGHPAGSRALFFYAQTSIHVNATLVFYIHTSPTGGTTLVEKSPKPKKPGVTPGTYTIEHVKISVSGGTAKKPYIANVTSCHRSWPFSFTIKNYFKAPSVTAHDKVKCQ
jgi:hypothetical protein